MMEFAVEDWGVSGDASTLADRLFGGEKKPKSKKARKRAHAENLKSTQQPEVKASHENTETQSPKKKKKTKNGNVTSAPLESKKAQVDEADYIKQIFVVPAESGNSSTGSKKKNKKKKQSLQSTGETVKHAIKDDAGKVNNANIGVDSGKKREDKKRKLQSGKNGVEETAMGIAHEDGSPSKRVKKRTVNVTELNGKLKTGNIVKTVAGESVESSDSIRETDKKQKKKRKRKNKKNKFKDYDEETRTTETKDASNVNSTPIKLVSSESKTPEVNKTSKALSMCNGNENNKTKKLKKGKDKGKKQAGTDNKSVKVLKADKGKTESPGKKSNQKSHEVDEAALQLWKERKRLKRAENRKKKKLQKKQGKIEENALGKDGDTSDDEYVEVITDINSIKGKHKISGASKKESKSKDESKKSSTKSSKLGAKHNHLKKKGEDNSDNDDNDDDDDDNDVATEMKETDTSTKPKSLLEKSRERLNAARFRYLNEQLYTTTGKEALKLFKQDRQAFQVYHDGFHGQVEKWPTNPVDLIIEQIKAKQKSFIVADFGCGDAKIARSVPNKVHSFDLAALNKHVTVCDMSKVPLEDDSIDIAVFCLSLMGTNLVSYLKEANRVLKQGGSLLIAEVTSRFASVDSFVKQVEKLGFTKRVQEGSNKMFVFLDFKKTRPAKVGDVAITLKPCIYKKR